MISAIILSAWLGVSNVNYAPAVHHEILIEEFSEEEIDLLSSLVAAEAEGESELGQRLVIDTVLNRLETEGFPDDVRGVIFQTNQYSPISDGSLYKFGKNEKYAKLIREEQLNRTSSEVLYFRTKKYSKYGDPLFVEGHHYFSGKKEITNE